MKTFRIALLALGCGWAVSGISAEQQQRPVREPSAPSLNVPAPFHSLHAVHAEFHRRFINAPGFGVSRVARPEFYTPGQKLNVGGQDFIVAAPQLIGADERPHPIAYVTPQPLRLSDVTNQTFQATAKKRPLTVFETNAMAQLARGEDLVVEQYKSFTSSSAAAEDGGSLRFVAALRATQDCLRCHNGSPGQLLGAFSYVFPRAPGAPLAPAAREKPVAAVLLRDAVAAR